MRMSRLEKLFINSQKHARRVIERADKMLKHIQLKKKNTLLEVGCGNGSLARHLVTNYDFAVTGIDIDPGQIRIAEKKSQELSNLVFLSSDAISMNFRNNTFDIVLSFGVMHHIHDWQKALINIKRVLKLQGYFIYGDYAYSHLIESFVIRFAKRYGVFTFSEIVHFFEDNGFIIVYKKPASGGGFSYFEIIAKKVAN